MTKFIKDMTIDFTKTFDVKNLSFGPLEDAKGGKGQKNAYPIYSVNGNQVPPFFQLVWFLLETGGGVPRLGEFYTDDSQRSFVKIPMNTNIPLVKECCDKLMLIDEFFGSDKFKEDKLGATKAKKYIYQPIVRFPLENDEEEDVNKLKKKSKFPYIKVKIDTNYEDSSVKTIVYNSVLDPTDSKKRIRNKIEDVVTIDDFSKHVCYMNNIRPIVKPFKMWFLASNIKDPKYGISLKMIKVEVEPSAKIVNEIKNYLENDDTFLESDNENEVKVVKQVELSSSSHENSKLVSEDKLKKKVPVVIDNESDSSDEEQAIPAKSTVIKSDSESDSDSEEEIKTKVISPKTNSKKVTKKLVDSDEEIKPVAKKASAKSKK
jgi:hypothetical protein